MPHWTAHVSSVDPTIRHGLELAGRDVIRGARALGRGAAVAGLGLAMTLALAMTQPNWRESLSAQVAAVREDSKPDPADVMTLAPSDAAPAAGALTPAAIAALVSAEASATRAESKKAAEPPVRLNKQQAALASWIARRYSVSVDSVGRLVQESWKVGRRSDLDPTLILAIMGIESSFNPFAQSRVGAQGLMQVMTNLHDKKFVPFGGTHAAFDPLTNLQVGVLVLKECLSMTGDIPTALQYYSGAARLAHDQGYANKVLSEQAHLKNILAGKPVAVTAANDTTPLPVRSPKALAAATATAAPASPAPAAPVPEAAHPVLQQTFGNDAATAAPPPSAQEEHPTPATASPSAES